MDENVQLEETTTPKKRGRKPGSATNKNYFGPEEEQAFQEFLLTSDPKERDLIFNNKLRYAFTKMIESIIRRYNLFTPYEDFTDTFNDTMSFLATKASNFKPGKGKKAYSYCGTICKNYLINKRLTTMKRSNKFLSYDEIYNTGNPDTRVDTPTKTEDNFTKTLIFNTINDISDTIDEGFWDDGTEMSDNEKKVGYAIIELFKNWETVIQIGSTQKFNKTNIMYFIKENTMLSNKDVISALGKYKLGYYTVKEKVIKDSYNS